MSATARLLVVEDDPRLREIMSRALRHEGHQVDDAVTLAEAQEHVGRSRYDLVLLDLGLPDGDGLDVLSSFRERADVPVIVVTGRDSLGDRVLGLDAGADDYVVKPVSVAELAARVRAVLRRSRATHPDMLSFGPVTVDFAARDVRVDGRPVDLTRKEFELLRLLVRNPNRVFTRTELLREVWRSAPEFQLASTVTEHVRRLRRKLEPDADEPRWIRTVRGVGYRFVPEERVGA